VAAFRVEAVSSAHGHFIRSCEIRQRNRSFAGRFISMNWITETICIGNDLDARDLVRHRAEGIRSLVCLDGKWRGVEAMAVIGSL
jgi:hypothetical protein